MRRAGAVPRVLVALVDAAGATSATPSRYPDGTFRLSADAPAGCRRRGALTGFQPAIGDCGTARPDAEARRRADPAKRSSCRRRGPKRRSGSSRERHRLRRADIERRQNPPLSICCAARPAVVVVGNGSRGAVTSLFLRGGESNYTKVLLDGIPLNEPGGTFDFGSVTTEHLERVELVRGAQSALFGSDAMSGVMQMFTAQRRAGRPARRRRVEGGTFGTARVSAGAAGRAGAFDYSVGAARYPTNNDVPNNEFDNTTLSGSAGVDLRHGARCASPAAPSSATSERPDRRRSAGPTCDASFHATTASAASSFAQTLSSSFTQRATYALVDVAPDVDEPRARSALHAVVRAASTAPFEFFDFAYDSRNDLRRHYASYQGDWRLPRPDRSPART